MTILVQTKDLKYFIINNTIMNKVKQIKLSVQNRFI